MLALGRIIVRYGVGAGHYINASSTLTIPAGRYSAYCFLKVIISGAMGRDPVRARGLPGAPG